MTNSSEIEAAEARMRDTEEDDESPVTVSVSVYAFRTEYEGITEVDLYATEAGAIRAAFAHIEDWYKHREEMIGGQLVWATEHPERVTQLTEEATALLPIRKALNARDHETAISLYNEWNPDDYSCGISPMDVRP